MKIHEFTNKPSVFLTNEEAEFLKKFNEKPVARKDLSDRDQLLAHSLVIKEILFRYKENGKTFYKRITEQEPVTETVNLRL